jgi:hypothetical protein
LCRARVAIIETSAGAPPEFCDSLPCLDRKPWMSKNITIAIFDVAAFVLALIANLDSN